jgi:PPP family 3-phenylpropionic acid transporter
MTGLLSGVVERRDLRVVRAYYFVYVGGVGFISPFLNLFYTSLGLSGKQIGTFASIGGAVAMLIAPAWVNEVRKRPNPRSYIQLGLSLSALAYLLIAQQTSFWPIALIVFFQALATVGIAPLSDMLAVRVARAAGAGYGTVRVMGSLGWIFTVLASGWLIQRFGFKPGFYLASLAYASAALLLFGVRPQNFSAWSSSDRPQTSLRGALRRVAGDRILVGFALALALIGFLNNGVLQFENVYLAQLGATKSLISIASILSAIVELPFMIYSDRIVRRLGAHRALLAALGMYVGLRLIVLVLPATLTIMAVRFVTGVSFSLYTVAFIGLISSRTPPDEAGAVLALYSVTLAGLVSILASPIAGALFDSLGARWLYAFAAAGYSAAVIILWFTRSPKVVA